MNEQLPTITLAPCPKGYTRDLDKTMSPAQTIARVRERLQRDDLTVLGYRFDGDRWCTAQRFDAYRQALGPHFIAHVLPDSAAHPEPTLQARDQILQFLRGRLLC